MLRLSTVPVTGNMKGILSPFGKLKVFYQILIVIVIMMAFLIGEGIIGINNISKMQQRNQEIVSKGLSGLDSLFSYKMAVERLRRAYSEALLNKSQGSVAFERGELRIALEDVDIEEAEKQKLIRYVDEIGKLLIRPVSEQNWKEIEEYITQNGQE